MTKKNRILAFIVCTVLLFTSYGAMFEVFAADNTTLAAGGSLASNTYTLNGNINLADQITVSAGATVKITGYGTITNNTDDKYTTTKGQNMFENYGDLTISGTSSTQRIIIDQAGINNYTAIWNIGKLTLENVTIINAGSSTANASKGGAISSSAAYESDNVTPRNSCSSLIMDNVIIKDCYGRNGAAIYINPEVEKGPTLDVQMTNVQIINCTDVEQNGTGAGLSFHGDANITAKLNNVTFNKCDAASGGGIYFNNVNPASTLEVTSCTFTGCTSSTGSALTVGSDTTLGSKVTVDKCTITGCSANNGTMMALSGGGSATVDVKNTLFENNTSEGSTSGEGGGIRTNGNGNWQASFTDCVFRNNFTHYAGAAIYWNATGENAKLNIIDCQFLNNSTSTASINNRGGALFLEGNNISISGSDGTPTAPITTGAVPESGIIGTLIQGNTSMIGGGIAFKTVESIDFSGGSDIKLGSNIIIKGNKAAYGGGVSYQLTKNSTDGASAVFHMTIDGPEIIDNSATADGGAIYIDRGAAATLGTMLLSVYKGNISNNTSAGNGGALSVKDGNVEILQGTVSNNTAGGDGGAINISGGNVVIGVPNCVDHAHPVMNNNTATGKGGGIAISGGAATMYCGNVYDNTSTANQASNNFNQSGANSSFTISGTNSVFGPGVNTEAGEFYDQRNGQSEAITVEFVNYYDGEEKYVQTNKVVLIGGTMCLPTSDDLDSDFTRDGYYIYGWTLDPNITEGCLMAGDSAIITDSVRYYTVWVKDGYTIVTEPNNSETGGESTGARADNNGYNYNIPYTDASITMDGKKDTAYANAQRIYQTTYRLGSDASNTSTAEFYVINGKHSEKGEGLYIYVEVSDSTILETYTHYTISNPKGDFVEFFIDFPNDHNELLAAGEIGQFTSSETDGYRYYAGRADGTNAGGAGWIVVGPPGCGLVASWGFGGTYTQHLKSASQWITDGAGKKTGYSIELFVPFPTSVLPNAADKMNTKCIGIGYETYNVVDAASYTNLSKDNAVQYVYASGGYAGSYYLRYDRLANYYLTPDTTLSNPTSYEFTTDDEYLSFGTPYYNDKIFNGWTLSSADGNWTAGTVGSPINIANKYGNVTMTAQWATRASGTYSIVYNLNGGVNGVGNPYSFTANVTLKAPTRDGYTFNGWIDIHTGTNIGKTPTLAVGKNYALYASWTMGSYTAWFYYGDGTLVSGNGEASYNENTAIALPTLKRDGYVFLGWYAASSDGNWQKGEEYIEGTTGKYGDVNLNAIWVPATSDVTLSLSCGDNEQGFVDNEQGFVLVINGTPIDTEIGIVSLRIVVAPGDDVKLRLPAGDYTIETYGLDSWRYEVQTLNIVFISNTIYEFEMGSKSNEKWLNAHAYSK